MRLHFLNGSLLNCFYDMRRTINRLYQFKFNHLFIALLMLFIISCNNEVVSDKLSSPLQEKDTSNYDSNKSGKPGVNESQIVPGNQAGNQANKKHSSIINTDIDTTLLFGIWTIDADGPHADFQLTGKSFYVADYDGDGDMPYELKGNHLKIFYSDNVQEGNIYSVDKDTLKILWNKDDIMHKYVRWKQ